MMNRKDLALGLLTVTATILLTGLVLLHVATPQRAMAFGQRGVAGDYLVATSQLNKDAEVLCVFNSYLQRMNVYLFNPETRQIELLQPSIPVETRAVTPPPANRSSR